MTQSNALAHPLRRLIIAAFPLGLILSIIDAIFSGPTRIIGLSGILVSAVASAFLLFCKSRGHEGEYRSEAVQHRRNGRDPTISLLLFIYDALSGAGILTFLIFTWVWIEDRWTHGMSVLTAYATVPYLLVFFIHAYLALLTLINLLDRPSFCSRCRDPVCSEAASSIRGLGLYQDSRGGYRTLDEADQPLGRPSVDTDADEDARLIGDHESQIGIVSVGVSAPKGGTGKHETTVQIL